MWLHIRRWAVEHAGTHVGDVPFDEEELKHDPVWPSDFSITIVPYSEAHTHAHARRGTYIHMLRRWKERTTWLNSGVIAV